MTEVKIDDYCFEVDIDKTRAYYREHSLCDCPACRNFYIQVKSHMPKVAEFMEQFGADISRPDEIGWADLDEEGNLDYIFAAYTANGKIKQYGKYEIDIHDNLTIQIVINENYIPNNQADSDYFTIHLYNIKLPWVLSEPFYESKKSKFNGFWKRIFKTDHKSN